MRGALDQLTAVGGTAMGLGLERGLEAARTPVPDATGTGTRRLPAVLVLLSDGKDTQGGVSPLEVAQRAKQCEDPDLRDRARHARRPGRGAGLLRLHPAHPRPARHRDAEGDRHASAAAASTRPPTRRKLEDIYSGLGTRLSSREEKEEVTVAFAGGALVLLLAGGALSMAWFGRPAVAPRGARPPPLGQLRDHGLVDPRTVGAPRSAHIARRPRAAWRSALATSQNVPTAAAAPDVLRESPTAMHSSGA